MNRRNLEYFLAVSREGSMAAAADSLHLTQPALSQAIKQLERDLGSDLFVRLPRGTRLTPAGEALLGPAKQILRDFETARASVNAVRGLTGGTLDLVTMPGVMKDPLAEWISVFRQRAPKVLVRIHETESPDEILTAVRQGDQELGFSAYAAQAPDLRVERVAQQSIVAVLPPGWTGQYEDSVSNEELVECGLIVGKYGAARDIVRKYSEQTGVEQWPVIEVDRRDTAVSLVLVGAGAALLPFAVARTAQMAGAVVRQLQPPVRRDIYLVERAGQLSPAARAFCRLIHEARG